MHRHRADQARPTAVRPAIIPCLPEEAQVRSLLLPTAQVADLHSAADHLVLYHEAAGHSPRVHPPAHHQGVHQVPQVPLQEAEDTSFT